MESESVGFGRGLPVNVGRTWKTVCLSPLSISYVSLLTSDFRTSRDGELIRVVAVVDVVDGTNEASAWVVEWIVGY